MGIGPKKMDKQIFGFAKTFFRSGPNKYGKKNMSLDHFFGSGPKKNTFWPCRKKKLLGADRKNTLLGPDTFFLK